MYFFPFSQVGTLPVNYTWTSRGESFLKALLRKLKMHLSLLKALLGFPRGSQAERRVLVLYNTLADCRTGDPLPTAKRDSDSFET